MQLLLLTATRKRAQLVDQQKNILLRKLQKNGIKTLKTENVGASRTTVRLENLSWTQSTVLVQYHSKCR